MPKYNIGTVFSLLDEGKTQSFDDELYGKPAVDWSHWGARWLREQLNNVAAPDEAEETIYDELKTFSFSNAERELIIQSRIQSEDIHNPDEYGKYTTYETIDRLYIPLFDGRGNLVLGGIRYTIGH